MTPLIMESDTGGLLVLGGSGGSMITSAVALVSPLPCARLRLRRFVVSQAPPPSSGQTIVNRFWLQMSLKDAIATPIVYVDSRNNVKFERGFDEVRTPPPP